MDFEKNDQFALILLFLTYCKPHKKTDKSVLNFFFSYMFCLLYVKLTILIRKKSEINMVLVINMEKVSYSGRNGLKNTE